MDRRLGSHVEKERTPDASPEYATALVRFNTCLEQRKCHLLVGDAMREAREACENACRESSGINKFSSDDPRPLLFKTLYGKDQAQRSE